MIHYCLFVCLLKRSTMTPEDKYPKVSAELFHSRAKELSNNHLMFVFSIMKGISVTTAAVVFVNIVLNVISAGEGLICDFEVISLLSIIVEFGLKLILFGVSFNMMLVTYDGAFFGTLFLSRMPGRKDTTYNFIQAGLEFLLFAILSASTFNMPDTKGALGLDCTIVWFIIFSINAVYANKVINAAIESINPLDYHSKICNIVIEYVDELRDPESDSPLNGSRISAWIGFIVFTLTCLVTVIRFFLGMEDNTIWQLVVDLFLLAVGIKVYLELRKAYKRQHENRIKIARLLSQEESRHDDV